MQSLHADPLQCCRDFTKNIFWLANLKFFEDVRNLLHLPKFRFLVDSLVLNQCFFMSKFFVYAFFSDVLNIKYLHKRA